LSDRVALLRFDERDLDVLETSTCELGIQLILEVDIPSDAVAAAIDVRFDLSIRSDVR